jgi:hypothetical protein
VSPPWGLTPGRSREGPVSIAKTSLDNASFISGGIALPEMDDLEQDRRARIRRNRAVLEKFEVGDLAWGQGTQEGCMACYENMCCCLSATTTLDLKSMLCVESPNPNAGAPSSTAAGPGPCPCGRGTAGCQGSSTAGTAATSGRSSSEQALQPTGSSGSSTADGSSSSCYCRCGVSCCSCEHLSKCYRLSRTSHSAALTLLLLLSIVWQVVMMPCPAAVMHPDPKKKRQQQTKT